jgi:hypothetical protein
MQSTGHIIIAPDGDAIDLRDIRRIDSIEHGAEGVVIVLYYKGIDANTKYTMRYYYGDFEGTNEAMRECVKNIRMEMLTIMNGGIPPVQIMGGLKKKKNGK